MNITWRKRITAALALVAINVYSCGQATDEPEASEPNNGDGAILADGSVFTRAALLEAFADCIVSEVTSFEEQSQNFAAAVHAAELDPEAQGAAKEAWQATMDAWQQLELMQVGPAGIGTQPGGQGWRDAIYAWPLNHACAVDGHLVPETYAVDPGQVRANANGLSAAEYLLFYSGRDNACHGEDEINVSGSWDALDGDTLANRRARYASFAADTVANAASALVQAWSPTGENFLAELTRAGDGSRTYGKKRVAINAVSDALFYIEWNTKDNKLARPLGMIGCDEDICTDLLESRYGRRSKEHIRNNLVGFRKIFTGCGTDNHGLGFDDYLYAMEQAELAGEIDQAALDAMDAIDAIDEEDLVTALEVDRQSVQDVHSAMRRLTDLLRSDFLTVLRLELPQMVQGDND